MSDHLVIIATDNLSVQLAGLHGAFHCGFVVAFPRLLLFICWVALEVVALLCLSADMLARWSRISKPQCIVAFPMLMVYIAVMRSYVSASNCSVDRLNLWFFFFHWFPHGRALLAKNYQIKLLTKFGILSRFGVLGIIHFSFNLRHTKTIGNINVWKGTEAGAAPGAKKN